MDVIFQSKVYDKSISVFPKVNPTISELTPVTLRDDDEGDEEEVLLCLLLFLG